MKMFTFERTEEQTRLAFALKLFMTAEQIDGKEVAKAIGCSPSTVTRFLQGTAMPEARTVVSLIQWMLEK